MKVVPGTVESTEAGKTVLLTGPASGRIELHDGTVIDVTDAAVEVDTHRLDEIHHHIELQHERTGNLDVSAKDTVDGKAYKFKHQKCGHCGKR